jgi:hypothetical protein
MTSIEMVGGVGAEVAVDDYERNIELAKARSLQESESVFSAKYVCEDISECCSDQGVCCCCTSFWVAAVLIVTIVVLAGSLSQVDNTEVGLMYDAYQADLATEPKENGLHVKPTFGYYIMWPKTHQTLNQVIKCLSSDGVQVDVTVAFQYIPQQKYIYFLTKRHGDFSTYKKVLQLVSRSGIRNACSMYTAQEYQTMRAAVQQSMLKKLKTRLDEGQLHAMVLQLQVTNIIRPKNYELAVDSKEAARNSIAQVQNKRAQLVTQANTKLMKVKVAANKTIDTAVTTAAITTKNAEAEAAIVLGRYKAQGELYKKVRETRALSAEGLLAYIGTRLVDELNDMVVGLDAPARMAYLSGNTTG